ncbi:hypothetical protein ACGFZK_01550 [Streptomyces sp. NPDC048257]|uniref:hypothetical protein n=1 Tax=Streptomyces sp. NPDC048257 TaxID=3365526 RepID=UPI003718FDEB
MTTITDLYPSRGTCETLTERCDPVSGGFDRGQHGRHPRVDVLVVLHGGCSRSGR